MISGTADLTFRRCGGCGGPEHGNLACDYSFALALDLDRSVALPASLRAERTYRVMDDQLFEVHPGSPPSEEDHCCLCAYRERSK